MVIKKTRKKNPVKKATTKIVKKVEKIPKQAAVEKDKAPIIDTKKRKEKYFQGLGRRKTSVAQVRMFETAGKIPEQNDIVINGRKFAEYFTVPEIRDIVVAPFQALDLGGKMRVDARIRGGGVHGQADALRLAISRAIRAYDENFTKALRDLGYLTRDARKVERKKAGLKKARRAPQWKKR
jgi:small subunit ribosomal protein S9